MTWAWMDTSSAATGSSQTRKDGCHHQRAGDADALALPAGYLVRKTVAVVGAQAHVGQRAVHARGDVGGLGASFVHLERLAQDLPYAMARVQRRLRVLEHHLYAQHIRQPLASAQFS